MKAVILEETRKIVVRDVPDAEIRATTDALLRLTSSAICGTDLHFYEGRMRGLEGQIIGHEPLGIAEEVGSAVRNVKKGDRVVVPTRICCGFCAMCAEGHSSACLTTNPGQAGAAYGYPNKGGYQGAQTELLRVPFADANGLKLPGEPGDGWEDDFVLLSDAFPTGLSRDWNHRRRSSGHGGDLWGGRCGFDGRIFGSSPGSGTRLFCGRNT